MKKPTPASVKKHMASKPKGYEGSRFDAHDKKTGEGTPADRAADKKQIPKFLASKKKGKK